MKIVEVLGPGCNNCRRLEAVAREAVAIAGVEAEIRHVTDYAEIVAHGVMSTPGLVIDGKVVSVGRIPSADDIAACEAVLRMAPALARRWLGASATGPGCVCSTNPSSWRLRTDPCPYLAWETS